MTLEQLKSRISFVDAGCKTRFTGEEEGRPTWLVTYETNSTKSNGCCTNSKIISRVLDSTLSPRDKGTYGYTLKQAYQLLYITAQYNLAH
jgi:hypothetical protein